MDKKRYHDLDALRASAMLLGILLHADLYLQADATALQVPVSVRSVIAMTGANAPEMFDPYDLTMSAIHGFRMPLFFLISGFFMAMLWKSRGLRAMLTHRGKRILLPMFIFVPLLWGSILVAIGLGLLVPAVVYYQGDSIWTAARGGNVQAMAAYLQAGGEVDAKGPLGETLLHWAAAGGHAEAVQFLLDSGAYPDARWFNNTTPLMWATMFGRANVVPMLLDHRADLDLKKARGLAAKVFLDKNIYKLLVYSWMFDLECDRDRVLQGRAQVRPLFEQAVNRPKQACKITPGPLRNFDYRLYPIESGSLPDLHHLEPVQRGDNPSGMVDLGLAAEQDHFAIEFAGELVIHRGGDFTFRLSSDHRARLYVNGKQVIDQAATDATQAVTGAVPLPPGPAAICVQYFAGAGAADHQLALSVSGPGINNLLLSKDGLAPGASGESFEVAFRSELPGWMQGVLGSMRRLAEGGSLLHLWFLNYLLWLVAGFALIGWLAGRLGIQTIPTWLVASPWSWLWILPITLLPQLLMTEFGPETTSGLIPWFPLLFYYAIFFAIGALCFGLPQFDDQVGRHWRLNLALAVPVLILGISWLHTREESFRLGYAGHRSAILLSHVATSVCQVLFVWLMLIGSIGLFRRYFAGASKTRRFVSDSSYWLYLVHVPVLVLLAAMFRPWDLPVVAKLVLMCSIGTAVLLVLYQTHVRYTWVGTLLNGKRPPGDFETSGRKRSITCLLCVFACVLGLHRFYAGKYWSGIVQAIVFLGALLWLLFGGPKIVILVILAALIWAVLDFISIVSGVCLDGDGRLIQNWI